MALIKKKTRKAITKQVKKLVRKHGPEIATGLVTSIVSGIAAAATAKPEDDDTPKKSRKRDEGDEEKPKKKKAKKE
jgi:thiamine phosphate synthase YjbQ (UPF0047 family)